jgi:Fe-S-cluster containining protein
MAAEYAEILERGLRNKAKYTGFLKNLKKKRKLALDSLFCDAQLSAFESIDCLLCGRCCTELGPRITNKDVLRLARREGLKPARFIETYLRTDEDSDLVFSKMPCPFFGSDGYCIIYEDRPDACRDYPHMDQSRQRNRIGLHIENLAHCPAVVLTVEKLISTVKI